MPRCLNESKKNNASYLTEYTINYVLFSLFILNFYLFLLTFSIFIFSNFSFYLFSQNPNILPIFSVQHWRAYDGFIYFLSCVFIFVIYVSLCVHYCFIVQYNIYSFRTELLYFVISLSLFNEALKISN